MSDLHELHEAATNDMLSTNPADTEAKTEPHERRYVMSDYTYDDAMRDIKRERCWLGADAPKAGLYDAEQRIDRLAAYITDLEADLHDCEYSKELKSLYDALGGEGLNEKQELRAAIATERKVSEWLAEFAASKCTTNDGGLIRKDSLLDLARRGVENNG